MLQTRPPYLSGRRRSAGDGEVTRTADGLKARGHSELREDRRDVVPDSLLRQVQPRGDVGVAQTRVEQVEHLELAVGEPADVRARGSPGTARHLRPDGAQLRV